MLINDLNNLMNHESHVMKFIGDQGSDVDVKMHSMRDIIASLRKQLITEHLHIEKKESVKVRVLQPEEPIKVIWDLIGMAFIFLQMISIPLILVFSLDLDPGFNTFSQIMDFYFIMDIIISFQTGYYNNGHFIVRRKSIALNYLRFWFWIDLISSFPYDEVILWGTSGDGPNLSVIKFVRFIKFVKIIRLVRALKLKKIINQLEDYLSLDTKITSVLGFLKISVMIMCISHWLACCWSLIDILENSGNTWYGKYSSDPNWQIEYISGLYFSVTTMITVGYGDIVPITYSEKLFSVLVMIVSTNFYGYIMSSIVAIFQSEDEGTSMVMYKNDVILKYIKQKAISINLQQRVKNYLQWLSNQEQIARNYECIIIQSLSINLKREILIQVQAKFVIHISFISHNFDRGLIDKVAFNLAETMLGPEEYVFKDTDSIDDNTCLYYITNGQVEIQAVHKIKKLKKRRIDNQSYFGEISFIANRKRCASVKTLTFVNLLYISRIQFVSLLSQVDLEKWFEIKFQIENEDNLCSLHINCYICRLPGHVAKYCPTVHYIVSSDKILQLVEQQQYEIKNKHKLRKQCSLKLLKQNRFAIQRIQEEMPNIIYQVQKQQERNQLKDSFINDKVQQYTCFTPRNNLQSIVSFQNDAADFYIKQIKSEKASKLVAEKFSKLKSKLNFSSSKKGNFLNLVKQAKQAADDQKSQINSSSESNPVSNQTSKSPSPYIGARRSIDQNMVPIIVMKSKFEKQSSHEEQKRLTTLPRRSQNRCATSQNAIQLEKLQFNKVVEVPDILEESPKIQYYSKK